MRILFDQGTPAPLRQLLLSHVVTTAFELGWATLKNGEMLTAAQSAGFEVLVTTDTNLRYQQNLKSRQIAIVVLSTTSWPRIKLAAERIAKAVDLAVANSYTEVDIPWSS
jgi:hypothetical protein